VTVVSLVGAPVVACMHDVTSYPRPTPTRDTPEANFSTFVINNLTFTELSLLIFFHEKYNYLAIHSRLGLN